MMNKPNRHITRDLQRYCAASLIHEIAAGQSAINRRLCFIESHIATQQQQIRKIKRENEINTRIKQTEHRKKHDSLDSSYWYETATTLSKENSELVDKITKYEEKLCIQNTSISRLAQLRTALENELTEANREIIRLTAYGNGCMPSTQSFPPSKTRSIPVSTEGKDAVHWYQTCRSLETLHIQKTAELEGRIEALLKKAEESDTKRRKTVNTKVADSS